MLNGRESTEREKMITELRNDEKLEDHFNSLLSICRNDRLNLATSGAFFLRHSLGSLNEQLVLLAISLKICTEDKFAKIAKTLWSSIQHKSSSPLTLLFHHVLIDKGFAKMAKTRKSELEGYIGRLNGDRANIVVNVEKTLGKMNDVSPLPVYELAVLGPVENDRVYIDSFRSMKEGLKRVEVLGNEIVNCSPEMLLPLPDVIELGANDFLTPFPILVEMPTLNLSNDIGSMLPVLLDNVGNSDPEKLKVD